MKRYVKKLLLVVITALSMSVTGCGSNYANDNGFVMEDIYSDTGYWEENNSLNIVTNVSIIEQNIIDTQTTQVFSDLSSEQEKKVEKLKEAIKLFFQKRYNIDFSEELNQQKVTFFNTGSVGNGITLGYIDLKDSNTLHLNILLNSEYKNAFEATYVHETLHQLGFKDEYLEMTYVVEGIVDAYTDIILSENHIVSQLTVVYFETRQLGYQMIAADENLPYVIINKNSLQDYINNALDKFTQPFTQKTNPAEYLNKLLKTLIAINSGTASSSNSYYYAFDAQSIVQKFCQAQNCSKETIHYIREHYIVDDFEKLQVVTLDTGGYDII